MGDFFEDLGKRITETAEAVSKKTEEVVGTQKLKNQIRIMERNNERDFEHLGKMIYERFQKGEVLDLKFVELCESIEQREESIEVYLKEIAELQGKEICKNCKGQLEQGMVYCPKCGVKVEKEEPAAEAEFEEADETSVAYEAEEATEATEEKRSEEDGAEEVKEGE